MSVLRGDVEQVVGCGGDTALALGCLGLAGEGGRGGDAMGRVRSPWELTQDPPQRKRSFWRSKGSGQRGRRKTGGVGPGKPKLRRASAGGAQ